MAQAQPRLSIAISLRASAPDAPAPGPEVRPLSDEIIRRAVLNYARGLAADLGIPVTVAVALERLADDQIPPEWPFLLSIGGQPARIDLRRSGDALPIHLPSEIYRNRILLITQEVAKCWAVELWGADGLRPTSLRALRQAMAACLDRNIGLHRLRKVLEVSGPGALADIWDLVFQAHSEVALGVWLWFHPERQPPATEQPLWDDDAIALQKDIFERLGTLCPLPLKHRGAEVGRDEFYLRINDARLPPFPLVSAKEARAAGFAAVRTQLLSEPQLLFTREGVEHNLNFLRETAPILVEQVLRRVGLNTICRILEGLVREQFAVTHLGRILDMLTFARGTYRANPSKYIVFTSDAETPIWKPGGDTALTADDYLRALRTNLKREITYRFADPASPAGSPRLAVVLLDREIEERLLQANDGKLPEGERVRLVRGFLKESLREPIIVLTTEEIRLRLWSLIHGELPDVTILAYQDLSPDCNIETLARISLAEAAPARPAPRRTPPRTVAPRPSAMGNAAETAPAPPLLGSEAE